MATKLYKTRDCSCTEPVVLGGKRPKACEHGHRFWTDAQLHPPERSPLAAVSKKRQAENQQAGRKARPPLKRTARRETPLEREARDHFNTTVKSWPCLFKATRPCEKCKGLGEVPTGLEGDYSLATCASCGGDGKHHCRGEKDAHHILKKSFLRQRFQAILPEPEFVAILFHPRIGAPLCRYNAHEPVEQSNDRIYWEDLSPECLEYVGSLPDFMLIELERKCPKRPPSASPDPQPMESVAAPEGVL